MRGIFPCTLCSGHKFSAASRRNSMCVFALKFFEIKYHEHLDMGNLMAITLHQ